MSRSRKRAWIRVSGTHVGSGTSGEIQLTVPIRGWIRRARAAGTGDLTLSVAEASSPGTFDTVLAYGTTTTPIDQEEDPGIFYHIASTDLNGQTGTLYVDVTTTSSGTDINVQFDIEPAN